MFTGTNGFACRQLSLYITFIFPNNLLFCFAVTFQSESYLSRKYGWFFILSIRHIRVLPKQTYQCTKVNVSMYQSKRTNVCVSGGKKC